MTYRSAAWRTGFFVALVALVGRTASTQTCSPVERGDWVGELPDLRPSGYLNGNLQAIGQRAFLTTQSRLLIYESDATGAWKAVAERFSVTNPGRVWLEGARLYLSTAGPTVEVFDATSLVGRLDPIASISLTQAWSSAIDIQSDLIAQVVDDSLILMDISDLDRPRIRGRFATTSRSVALAGHRAYLLDAPQGRIDIVDISDLSNPHLTAQAEIELEWDSRMNVLGRWGFVSSTNSVQILDLDEADAPALLGSFSSLHFAIDRGLGISEYSEGLALLDLSDPSRARGLGTLGDSRAQSPVIVGSEALVMLWQYQPPFSEHFDLATCRPQLPRPVADFDWSPTAPTAGQSVAFRDSSAGYPQSWSWDFGDGTTSNAANPRHTYATTGSFNIRLTVNSNGSQASSTRTIVVAPGAAPPVADFDWEPANPQPGEYVQFVDRSTGSPTRWKWTFGDRGTSTDQNPRTYSYSLISVTLEIESPAGRSQVSRTVPIQYCHPSFLEGDVVAGESGGKLAASGNRLYLGQGSYTINSIRIFDISNPLDTRLVGFYEPSSSSWSDKFEDFAVDGDRLWVLTYRHLDVLDVSDPTAPIALMSYPMEWGSYRRIHIDDDLAFVNDRSGALQAFDISDPFDMRLLGTAPPAPLWNPPAGGVMVTWNGFLYAYGNGRMCIYDIAFPERIHQLSCLDFATYAWPSVDFVVWRNYGYGSGAGLMYIDLSDPRAPIATRLLEPLDAGSLEIAGDRLLVAPEYFHLESVLRVLSLPGVDELGQQPGAEGAAQLAVSGSVAWTFGPRGLAAIDVGNCTTTAREPYPEETPWFRNFPVYPAAGQPTHLSGTAWFDVLAWNWDFGDGATAAGSEAIHTWDTPGSYVVMLTAETTAGPRTWAKEIPVLIPPQQPTSEFSWYPEIAVAGQPVRFADESGGEVEDRYWNFNDAQTSADPHWSNDENPIHTFSVPGQYRVQLRTTNASGVSTKERLMTVAHSAEVCQPTTSGQFETSDGQRPWGRFQIAGQRGYLGVGDPHIEIFDLADPDTPLLVGVWQSSGSSMDFVADANRIYAIDDERGLVVLDTTRPEAVREVAMVPDVEGYWLETEGDLLAVHGYGSGVLFDISNPTRPTQLAELPDIRSNVVFGKNRMQFVVSDEALVTFDTTHPSAPFEISRQLLAGVEDNYFIVARDGDRLAVSDHRKIWLFDSSDPDQPTPVGVYRSEHYAYVADMAMTGDRLVSTNGVIAEVLDVSGDGPPVPYGYWPTPTGSHAISAGFDRFYVTTDIGVSVLDPDPCDDTLRLIGAAHIDAANGESWRTELIAHNLGGQPIAIELELEPTDVVRRAGRTRLALGPHATQRVADVVGELLGSAGETGILRVRANSADVALGLRTYSQRGAGEVSQTIPMLDLAHEPMQATSQRLLGLSSMPPFRSNLGLVNFGEATLVVRVELLDASGQRLGTPFDLELEPGKSVQVNRVAEHAGVGAIERFQAVVHRLAGGRFLAWASRVDGDSGDPSFVSGLPASKVILAGLAAGRSGWQSEFELGNPENRSREYELIYREAAAPENAHLRTLSVGANSMAVIRSPGELFAGLGGGTAWLEVRTVDPDAVTPTIAAFTTHPGADGTVGQSLFSLGSGVSVDARARLVLPGARQDGSHQSRLGLLAADEAVVADVRLLGSDGAELARKPITIAAGALVQIDPFAWLDLSVAQTAASIEVRALSGGRLRAFLSVIDVESWDAGYLTAQRADE